MFRSIGRPAYDDQAREQVAKAARAKPADLATLLRGKDTWTAAG